MLELLGLIPWPGSGAFEWDSSENRALLDLILVYGHLLP